MERFVQCPYYTKQFPPKHQCHSLKKIHFKPEQILSSTAITSRKNKTGAITASDVKTEHEATVTKEVITNIYTQTLGAEMNIRIYY